MKKLLAIATVFVCVTVLSACDNAEQKKREECTQAQNDASDAFIGKVDKETGAIARKKWEELQCHQTDVIHH